MAKATTASRTREETKPAGGLSKDDLERLRYALGRRRVDLGASLYGPESITWRVNREAALLLGGGRALLLQVAHPLVAAGVAEHSNFRSQPLQRLWRTLELTLTITFADARGALRAVRAIERRHTAVRGRLRAPVGPFRRGTRYDAADPELQLWVHATLVDSAVMVYDRFVAPLPVEERAAYYEESKRTARLFGIPESLIPRTWAAFSDYVGDMVESETLAVGPESRDIAASILWPPLLPGLREVAALVASVTPGLLPPIIRERYGLSWGPARALGWGAVSAATRTVLPFLPRGLRSLPRARSA